MGVLQASFGVPRINWVLYMHPLEFQGLNGYCICVLWSSKNIKNLGFFKKQFLCSTLAVIHIKKSIEPKITIKNGILVFPSFVETSFFFTIVDISWFHGLAYHHNSQVILTVCSLNLVAPQLTCLKLHRIIDWVPQILLIKGW